MYSPIRTRLVALGQVNHCNDRNIVSHLKTPARITERGLYGVTAYLYIVPYCDTMQENEWRIMIDKGYVKLVNIMGSDVDVVNAARASFDRQVTEMSDRDIRLLNFLVREHHDSVFRHCTMTFEIYAPMMVKNQWIKHIVASTHLEDQFGWNEVSRRYVVDKPEYYMPTRDQWRSVPTNIKQGSGTIIDDPSTLDELEELYQDFIEYADNLYYRLMDYGVAAEQARLVLPGYAVFVRWRWTASLQAVLNFLTLRLGEGAQKEISDYAMEVYKLIRPYFPHTLEAWYNHRVIESSHD